MDDRTPAAIGRLAHARALKELTQSLRENRAATASGLWGSSVAAVTAALEGELKRPILLVCGHIDEADDLADDLELFHHRRPDVLPALELRSEEHTSELQSHRDLHSFPTRRSSDLADSAHLRAYR